MKLDKKCKLEQIPSCDASYASCDDASSFQLAPEYSQLGQRWCLDRSTDPGLLIEQQLLELIS